MADTLFVRAIALKLGGDVFGLDTTQFLETCYVISGVPAVSGMDFQTAIELGNWLSLPSSEFVLQLLQERGLCAPGLG